MIRCTICWSPGASPATGHCETCQICETCEDRNYANPAAMPNMNFAPFAAMLRMVRVLRETAAIDQLSDADAGRAFSGVESAFLRGMPREAGKR